MKRSHIRYKNLFFIMQIQIIMFLIVSSINCESYFIERNENSSCNFNQKYVVLSNDAIAPIRKISYPYEKINHSHIDKLPIFYNENPKKELLDPFYYLGGKKLTSNQFDDQNPVMTLDNRCNIITMYEAENAEASWDIGVSWSTDYGLSWNIDYGLEAIFPVDGNPSQPRIDYLNNRKAYGTWLLDPAAEKYGVVWVIFDDISDPNHGMGWVGYIVDTTEIIDDFSSIDLICYDGAYSPDDDFWGIIGVTGREVYHNIENKIIWFTWQEGNNLLFTGFNPSPFIVDNISFSLDSSNGYFILAFESCYASDPSNNNGVIISPLTIKGGMFSDFYDGVSMPLTRYPSVDTKDGRMWVVAERDLETGGKDIVCATTTSPEDWQSWEGYSVTTMAGNERFPTVYAINTTDAIVSFTKSGNLYVTKTSDGGKNWSKPMQQNEVDGTVVEQYGCSEINGDYMVWTDNRRGNNDIYFDILDSGSPSKPSTPSGPPLGKIGVEHKYTTSTNDPNGDDLFYWWDWDDDENSGWLGPYNSGETASAPHIWIQEGTYNIKVKAKDIEDHESEWSDPLPVSMPKNKATNTLFLSFLDQHPRMLTLLRHLLGL